MAYDKQLAMQVRAALGGQESLTQREMFGGIGFMIAGNMACGVIADDLIIRVGPDDYDQALRQEGVKEFDMTGRPMRGWVLVTGTGMNTDAELSAWVQKGVTFARSLPAK
jgi:TfoX/Sxy family transcriptional regulator of competence genes